jgi:hypothetical protein
MKKLLGAAMLALALGIGGLAASGTAEAGVNVDINIGIPGPVYVDPVPIYPGWGYRSYYARRWVNCNEGVQIVRASGFRSVRATDCRGSHYAYIGRAQGRTFYIQMRAGDGRIVGVRRL